MKILAVCTLAVLAVGLAACGVFGSRPPPRGMGLPRPPSDLELSIRLMLSYDSNHDGIVTREELDMALAREFAEADSDHDGKLIAAEIQEENDRRWKASGTGFSPLIDWNQDGVVDMAEFANTPRSVFSQLDGNRDGKLADSELRVPGRGRRGPMEPPQRRRR